MRCHNCGQEVPEGTRFCGYCGQVLATESTPRPATRPRGPFNEDAPTTLEPPPDVRPAGAPMPAPRAGPPLQAATPPPPQSPPRRRSGLWIAGIGALVVVALAACVAGVVFLRPADLFDQFFRPRAAPPTSVPYVPVEPVTTTISFTVQNQGASTICFIRISPTDIPEWGDDWLGSATIAVGSSYVFQVPPAEYDLRAEFCGGGEPEIMWDVDLTADRVWVVTGGGGVVATPIVSGQQPQSGDVTLTVVNQGSTTVCYMRISPTSQSTWGDDWLGSSVIPAGDSFAFSVPAGPYDLRAEDCSNSSLRTEMGVSLTGDRTWTVP